MDNASNDIPLLVNIWFGIELLTFLLIDYTLKSVFSLANNKSSPNIENNSMERH
jgi:hypothetical protein